MISSPVSKRLIDDGDDSVFIESIEEKDSPYAEVRASVPNWDNFSTPQSTLRMWVIGFILTTVAGCLNILLSLQTNPFAVSPSLVIIVAYPFGKLWERLMPHKRIWGIALNPGPFNIKEHGLIGVMAVAVVGGGPNYLTLIMGIKKYILHESLTRGFGVLLILSTQLFGLALAGLVRGILIHPERFIFPSSLVTVTLLTNLHIKSNYLANGWGISRLRLLVYLMVGGAMYQWVPTFLAMFMSNFSWAGWISPDNVVINQLFGITSGVALLPLCFDWNLITGYLGSPLVPPLGTLLNMATMVATVLWLIVPIISFTNTWYGDFLPMFSGGSELVDRYQQSYDVDRVLNENGKFDEEKYKAYSPIFLADANVVSYCISCCAIPATLVHFLLFDFKSVYKYFRSGRDNSHDIHAELMKKYAEVPILVYLVLYVFCAVLAVAAVHFYTELDLGILFLSMAIAAIMFVPNAILYATANIQLELGVFSEFVAGYLQQGNNEANMLAKTFCAFVNMEGILALQYMKMAHYLKLSPWAVFMVQSMALTWGGILQWVCMTWAGNHFENFCEPGQPQGFTCPLVHLFHNTGIIWGTIGSKRVFTIYKPVLYFYVIGALLPILSWLWLRKYPRSFFRFLHWPIFFNSAHSIPPATPYNYVTYLQAGFLFTFFIRRRYFNWWAKYNYTVSIGLELAVVMGTLIIVVVQMSSGITPPNWWGNVGFSNNVDARSVPRIVLPEGEAFGPTSW